MLDPRRFLEALEHARVVLILVDGEGCIVHAGGALVELEGRPFTELFPRSARVRAERLLEKARSRQEVSLLFRGSLDAFDDAPLCLLMGPLDGPEAKPEASGAVFCMLINWRDDELAPEAVGAELLSGVRSIHRLSNRVAAMRLNAEMAQVALVDAPAGMEDVRESVASIVGIARSIEHDLMRLAPYLNAMDGEC
jgi:hypothetical protein